MTMKRALFLTAILVLAGAVLAACGGGGTTATEIPVAATTADSDSSTPADTTEADSTSDSTSDSTQPETTDATVETDPATEPDAESTPDSTIAPLDRLNGPFPESDFPDAVVEDLSGEQVNVKFLGAESQPVLLWFYAPH